LPDPAADFSLISTILIHFSLPSICKAIHHERVRYGETDWDAQHRERADSSNFSWGILQRPVTGKSYEELRFGVTEEMEAQKFVEINYNAVGVGSSTSFVK
jgi:hypothetical protein